MGHDPSINAILFINRDTIILRFQPPNLLLENGIGTRDTLEHQKIEGIGEKRDQDAGDVLVPVMTIIENPANNSVLQHKAVYTKIQIREKNTILLHNLKK